MSQTKNKTLYSHPFSKAYWKDAASELKDTRVLVVAALMTALRIAMKPLAIPIAPQLSVQTATLATSLGAMIFGPVVAIPAAVVSDTIGFLLFPSGDYFFPFVLTEIASTVIYALCLYRSKVTPTRVMLARFLICIPVNIVLQQIIYAWFYIYKGDPVEAKNQIMKITAVARVLKNLAFFPVESVVLTLFLRAILPITNRAGFTFTGANVKENMTFSKKQVIILALMFVIGVGCGWIYLNNYYKTTSLTLGYSTAERYEKNTAMIDTVASYYDGIEKEKTVTTIEGAYKEFLGKEVTYTVAVYEVDEDGLSAYTITDHEDASDDEKLELIRGMSKSKAAAAAKGGALTKLGTATIVINEKTGDVLSFKMK